jgi:hypothetical protein
MKGRTIFKVELDIDALSNATKRFFTKPSNSGVVGAVGAVLGAGICAKSFFGPDSKPFYVGDLVSLTILSAGAGYFLGYNYKMAPYLIGGYIFIKIWNMKINKD